MADEELVEKVAEAIYMSEPTDDEGLLTWTQCTDLFPEQCDDIRIMARAAINAMPPSIRAQALEEAAWLPIDSAPTGIALDIWYAPGQLTPCRIPNAHQDDDGLWFDDQGERIWHPEAITHWMMPPHTPSQAPSINAYTNKAGGLWYRRWYEAQKELGVARAALKQILKNDTSAASNHVARAALSALKGGQGV